MMDVLELIKKDFDLYFKIDIGEQTRKREYIDARCMFYWLTYHKTSNSLAALGEFFNQDHATVLHGIKKFPDMMKYDADFKRKFEEIHHICERRFSEKPREMTIDELTFRYNLLLIENDKLKTKLRKLEKHF